MSGNSFTPGPTPNTVRAADGTVLTAPDGWGLLHPGDAALTRRVKEAGEHWVVQEKKGRKVFSRGVWAPATTINRIRAELEAEQSTESYAKRKSADARRREKAQAEYVEDFFGEVVEFLAFHPNHADLDDRLACAVTDHATPVGSGAVARTTRIPVEQRAEAAVIAWMRHQTTGYDGMVIARVKGKRREVRRMLAQRSKELLARYRRGEPVPEGSSAQDGIRFLRKKASSRLSTRFGDKNKAEPDGGSLFPLLWPGCRISDDSLRQAGAKDEASETPPNHEERVFSAQTAIPKGVHRTRLTRHGLA